jgi:hypothetical protein
MFIRLTSLFVAEVMFSYLHVPLCFRYKAVACTQQNVHCMLCTEVHKTYSTNIHAKSNLFRSYTLCYKLWCNFGGIAPPMPTRYLYSKKKLSELLLTLDLEILAGKFSRVWK